MIGHVILMAALSVPLAVTPTNNVSPINWSNIINESEFKIDIDSNSVKAIVRQNGFEMTSRLRMQFGKPFIIPGKTKLGVYYVNETSAKCKSDTFEIQKSIVYSADGEVLAAGVDVASIKNPKNAKSFVTVWLYLACDQFKGKKPPIII